MDISLAVEMLYLATVPDAYDVAVIITGDKDFMPAMQKTRLTGKLFIFCRSARKMVLICSSNKILIGEMHILRY